MRKLHLQYDEITPNSFTVKELNLMLCFQVNCPGCFLHGIPLFHKLMRTEELNEIGFIGLSTAFEDFDQNTKDNTEALLTNRELTGETKKAFIQRNHDKLPYDIQFPVIMDAMTKELDNIEAAVDQICSINPNYKTWSSHEQELVKKKIRTYLSGFDTIPETFTLNQFQGTPTFVLFNNQLEVLDEWFGHRSYEETMDAITRFIKK